MLYGVRLEANRYTAEPPFNPAVQREFGVRTDDAPDTVHLSPRLGFNWAYGGNTNFMTATTPLGTIASRRGAWCGEVEGEAAGGELDAQRSRCPSACGPSSSGSHGRR